MDLLGMVADANPAAWLLCLGLVVVNGYYYYDNMKPKRKTSMRFPDKRRATMGNARNRNRRNMNRINADGNASAALEEQGGKGKEREEESGEPPAKRRGTPHHHLMMTPRGTVTTRDDAGIQSAPLTPAERSRQLELPRKLSTPLRPDLFNPDNKPMLPLPVVVDTLARNNRIARLQASTSKVDVEPESSEKPEKPGFKLFNGSVFPPSGKKYIPEKKSEVNTVEQLASSEQATDMNQSTESEEKEKKVEAADAAVQTDPSLYINQANSITETGKRRWNNDDPFVSKKRITESEGEASTRVVQNITSGSGSGDTSNVTPPISKDELCILLQYIRSKKSSKEKLQKFVEDYEKEKDEANSRLMQRILPPPQKARQAADVIFSASEASEGVQKSSSPKEPVERENERNEKPPESIGSVVEKEPKEDEVFKTPRRRSETRSEGPDPLKERKDTPYPHKEKRVTFFADTKPVEPPVNKEPEEVQIATDKNRTVSPKDSSEGAPIAMGGNEIPPKRLNDELEKSREPAEKSAPVFEFGNPTAQGQNQFAPSTGTGFAFGEKATETPAFGNTVEKPAFSFDFGSKEPQNTTGSQSAALNKAVVGFGVQPPAPKESPKDVDMQTSAPKEPVVDFGAQLFTPKAPNAIGFEFGKTNPAETVQSTPFFGKANKAPESSTTPMFQFGNTAKSAITTPFNFGDNKNSSTPFDFGNNKAGSTPFAFGNPVEGQRKPSLDINPAATSHLATQMSIDTDSMQTSSNSNAGSNPLVPVAKDIGIFNFMQNQPKLPSKTNLATQMSIDIESMQTGNSNVGSNPLVPVAKDTGVFNFMQNQSKLPSKTNSAFATAFKFGEDANKNKETPKTVSFGANPATGGFAYNQASTSQPFIFGSQAPNAQQNTQPKPFVFGQTEAPQQTEKPKTGFSFSKPAEQNFAFGQATNPPTSTPATGFQQSNTGFNFAQNTTQSNNANTGFGNTGGFGATTQSKQALGSTSAQSAFVFGQPSSNPPVSNFGFGQETPSQNTGGFNFGGQQASTTPFVFGQPQQQQPQPQQQQGGGFNFGAQGEQPQVLFSPGKPGTFTNTGRKIANPKRKIGGNIRR